MMPDGSIPALNIRSGSALVAGLFLVGGFLRIFVPTSPSTPSPQKSVVTQTASSTSGGNKDDAYRAQIAGKIREAYGCSDSTSASSADPESNSWSVPANSRASLRFMIAFVPDPVHTHLAVFFDRNVEALELAVQHTGVYTFDRSVLPWHPLRQSNADDHKPPVVSQQVESYPGLLIFRKSEPPQASTEMNTACAAKDSLFVFLVAETPTSGIRAAQFHNALKIMRQIRSGASSPAEKLPLLILGPNFSGSLDSLRRQLLQISPEQMLSSIVIKSGTVSSASDIFSFQDAFRDDRKLPVTFESFQENDDFAIQMFTSFAVSRGYCSNEIAILSEADTVYGNQERRAVTTSTDGESGCPLFGKIEESASRANIVHLHFPREISFFRAAYQKELAAQAQSSAKLPNGKSTLPIETDEEANDDDAVATFARGQTAQSQEAVMFGVVGELHKHHIKFTIVLATNPEDQVFLARFLRANYPQGRIVVTSPDLLLQNQDDSLLYGVLGLNSYSLVPGIGDSFCRPADGVSIHADQLFDSSSSVGVFNAATALLFKTADSSSPHPSAMPRPMFQDYASPAFQDGAGCIARPSLWLTILGRDGFWPIAALNDSERLPNPQLAEPNLPVVSVAPVWKNHTTLPDLNDSLSPPARSALHTRPPWNVIYGLCLLLLVLHAYFSLTGSFLSNSESKAQFSRTGDASAAVILAIGAFWLCMAFVLLLCTRSLRLDWDTVWPTGITMLLWLPLPIFIVLTTCDLLNRCRKPAIAYTFLGVTLFFSTFQILLASGTVPGLQYVWSTRLIHLTSGVSPVFPFLLLFGCGYWWAWLSLRGVSIIDLRRPRLPAICTLPASAVRISETEGEKVRATAHPLLMRARVVGSLTAVFLVSISALEWRHPLQSLEGHIYDFGYSAALAFAIVVFLACLMRLVFTWFDYKQVLAGLDRFALREAFSRMKRLSWRSMWNPGGSTLRETYRVMSRTLECMQRFKGILAKKQQDGFPEVLEAIGATEDLVGDAMDDYNALFPHSCQEESFEELLKEIQDTHTHLVDAVRKYEKHFPPEASGARIVPFTPHHTLHVVRSANQKVLQSWQTYVAAFEKAKKVADASLSGPHRSLWVKLVSWLGNLRRLLSGHETFQRDPNRTREVVRQIKTAHARLVQAVSAHNALPVHGSPDEVISAEAHKSLTKIQVAQWKLIAALDRYAILFPATGGFGSRSVILQNLTKTLEELQKQLANTAGLVFSKVLTPIWSGEAVPSVSEDERLPKVVLDPERAIQEEFVALVYVNFLQSVLLQMRSLVICAGGMYVLLLCSMSVYPFEPHLALQILAVALVVIMAAAVGFVYKEMHSDAILGRLTSTKGELGWDFWIKFISAGAIPVFSLIAVQFPEVGKFLFSWLEPALQAVK